MSRLIVELYDAVGDVNPFLIIPDDVAFVDLNPRDGADKAARVVVKPGADYQPGDHVRLLDEVRPLDTDMVTVDPLVQADVNLNAVGFADKAAGLHFQLNPTGQFRLRIELYDQVGQRYPNLSFYDWQGDPQALINLNLMRFADKAARVRLATGGGFRPGDHVRLLDEVRLVDTDMVTVDPLVSRDVNLNAVGFADKAAGLHFQLNPTSQFRLRIDLHDQVGQPYPNLSLYDWQADPQAFMDLNRLHFADKTARAVIAMGGDYHPADHVRLLDEVRLVDTDMVTVDPLVGRDVNLNDLSFADRASGLAFVLNPGAGFDARVELFDTPNQPLPNLSLYDWQMPSGPFDLNSLHFADKAAAVRVIGRQFIFIPIPVSP
jgi:hypothetical protein